MHEHAVGEAHAPTHTGEDRRAFRGLTPCHPGKLELPCAPRPLQLVGEQNSQWGSEPSPRGEHTFVPGEYGGAFFSVFDPLCVQGYGKA